MFTSCAVFKICDYNIAVAQSEVKFVSCEIHQVISNECFYEKGLLLVCRQNVNDTIAFIQNIP